MTKMTVAVGDDDALKQEHQMLMPLLFGPNEHVAVTDRSLQQSLTAHCSRVYVCVYLMCSFTP